MPATTLESTLYIGADWTDEEIDVARYFQQEVYDLAYELQKVFAERTPRVNVDVKWEVGL